MNNLTLQIKGTNQGKHFSVTTKNGGEHPLFFIRIKQTDDELHIKIIPKKQKDSGKEISSPLILHSVRLLFPWEYLGDKKTPESIFMNGYQSWTDSHEKLSGHKEHVMPAFTKNIADHYHLDAFGDYNFTKKPHAAGQFHGFTYCYFRHGTSFRLLGSLSERQGYTIFYYDTKAQKIQIEKDCRGLEIVDEWEAFSLACLSGSEKDVFDTYFSKMNIMPPKGRPMTGYTSWYNHYQNISETVICDNLNSIQKTGQDWDIFQIDDGYQEHVGDWLSIDKTKFPNGLTSIADKIHQLGMFAGLWLAPFVCETDSHLFKEHPEFLERDEYGEPVCAGPNWSKFYALNLEIEEVKEYLRKVFHTVLNEWSFDLVKLDFLYAACIQPTRTKTRGQRMCEAMDFLRELVGDKLILGCGVPLGPAFGKVDYCRIGCDVGLDWDDKPYMRLLHRERISTKNAVGNAIYRRQLDGRAFFNDPDVYLLRDDNIRLTPEERKNLAAINGLFGSLLFTSDNVKDYDDVKQRFCNSLRELRTAKKTVIRGKKHTTILYEKDGKEKKLVLKV